MLPDREVPRLQPFFQQALVDGDHRQGLGDVQDDGRLGVGG
ncbi:hypothetical protein [Streptomyces regalis]